jgi:hypothetical protein
MGQIIDYKRCQNRFIKDARPAIVLNLPIYGWLAGTLILEKFEVSYMEALANRSTERGLST